MAVKLEKLIDTRAVWDVQYLNGYRADFASWHLRREFRLANEANGSTVGVFTFGDKGGLVLYQQRGTVRVGIRFTQEGGPTHLSASCGGIPLGAQREESLGRVELGVSLAAMGEEKILYEQREASEALDKDGYPLFLRAVHQAVLGNGDIYIITCNQKDVLAARLVMSDSSFELQAGANQEQAVTAPVRVADNWLDERWIAAFNSLWNVNQFTNDVAERLAEPLTIVGKYVFEPLA